MLGVSVFRISNIFTAKLINYEYSELSVLLCVMAARTLSHLLRKNPVSRRCTTLPALCRLGGFNGHSRPGDRRDDDSSRFNVAQALARQSRDIHVTPRSESSVLLAGVGVAASAMVARYGIQEYMKYKVSYRCLSGIWDLSGAF